ncbi:hypothetical protein J4233_05560 [Candidatus Pacearchaeota archaeon]|nr:hypothetical protein [Candidatus Pacearchaeota archaeon]
MKINNKRGVKLFMCAGCGKTFNSDSSSRKALLEHQGNNYCDGYFIIEMVNQRAEKIRNQ